LECDRILKKNFRLRRWNPHVERARCFHKSFRKNLKNDIKNFDSKKNWLQPNWSMESEKKQWCTEDNNRNSERFIFCCSSKAIFNIFLPQLSRSWLLIRWQKKKIRLHEAQKIIFLSDFYPLCAIKFASILSMGILVLGKIYLPRKQIKMH